ncbi:hypothetical protein Slin15195_G042620 [Septoria linicola]|uniref:Uncharacterized protein n=1 Tax=Septoria linicola TaxID=215465 RepID=A0A9Q9EJ32_9PEZI|nr:hypothetical protein Slin14017_G046140 [Septoria linicola]USW50943.1 hypothetical protein Slin15195_G042620 [Septoria linicola]
MAPFILDESDSKSSAHVTTSSVSSPDASTDSDSSQPQDLSLWATGETAMRELELESEQIDETWREVHGTEGTWEDRAIAHRIRQAMSLAQETTPSRNNAQSLDGTHDRDDSDQRAHAARVHKQAEEAWAKIHGLEGTGEDQDSEYRARIAKEAARALLGLPPIGRRNIPVQDESSGSQSKESDSSQSSSGKTYGDEASTT